ncbi:MAG: carbohydrate porin [Ketobacteraceae bacterium]|nr:carbohydrate porin [Ketobacteraceae bacterium]
MKPTLRSYKNLCLLLLMMNPAWSYAEEGFSFGGYFRAGTNLLTGGGTENGGSCYALIHPSNDGFHYRLGNECRDYAEFRFAKNLKENDLDFNLVWMIDIAGDSRSPTSTEEWSRRSRQLYVDVTGLLDNGTLWIGRRYYHSVVFGDLHMVDMFPVQSSGNGVGITDFRYGEDTRLHFALVAYGDDSEEEDNSFNYQNLLFDLRSETDFGSLGVLKLGLQHLEPREAFDDIEREPGTTLTIQWEKAFGFVDQKTLVQVGTGSMAENPGCAGTDGGCFDLSAEGGDRGYRVANHGMVEASARVIMNYTVVYEKSEDHRELTSVGVRPHYVLGRYWSLVAELSQVEESLEGPEDDTAGQRLVKATLALQATPDAYDFWKRPALRFYISQFHWNDAARRISRLGAPAESDNEALLLGVQTEVWF